MWWGGKKHGAGAHPPLWWLLDMKIMPLASHIPHQVARALLEGPVGCQVRVVMLDPACVPTCLIRLSALHITCYALQACHSAVHWWKLKCGATGQTAGYCYARAAGVLYVTGSSSRQFCCNSQVSVTFEVVPEGRSGAGKYAISYTYCVRTH